MEKHKNMRNGFLGIMPYSGTPIWKLCSLNYVCISWGLETKARSLLYSLQLENHPNISSISYIRPVTSYLESCPGLLDWFFGLWFSLYSDFCPHQSETLSICLTDFELSLQYIFCPTIWLHIDYLWEALSLSNYICANFGELTAWDKRKNEIIGEPCFIPLRTHMSQHINLDLNI